MLEGLRHTCVYPLGKILIGDNKMTDFVFADLKDDYAGGYIAKKH